MSTSEVVLDMVADVSEFLDGEADILTAILDDVADLGRGQAPVPTAELAVLLAGRRPPRGPVRMPLPRLGAASRASRTLAGLAAAAVAGLGVTGAAASANELPAPMQRFVAHLSEDYLPFSFPRPAGDPPAGGDVGSQPTGADPADGSAATSDGGSPQGKVHPRPAAGRGTVKTSPGPASARDHAATGSSAGSAQVGSPGTAGGGAEPQGDRPAEHEAGGGSGGGNGGSNADSNTPTDTAPGKSTAPTHGKAPTDSLPSTGKAKTPDKAPDKATGRAGTGSADGQTSTRAGKPTAAGQSVDDAGSVDGTGSVGDGGSGDAGE